MPEMITYEVTQVRKVQVVANEPLGAVQMAEAMFAGDVMVGDTMAQAFMPEGVWARPVQNPEVVSILAEKKQ